MAYSFLIGEMAIGKVTKEALAKKLNLHRNTISYKLEKGSFSIEEAAKIQEEFFPQILLVELFKKDSADNKHMFD